MKEYAQFMEMNFVTGVTSQFRIALPWEWYKWYYLMPGYRKDFFLLVRN